jgi:hypothetical protein
MASIHKEVRIAADAADAWAAVRDFGAVHERVAPGFLTGCRMEDGGGVRVVSFANGMQARERLIDLDDAARRLVWSVVDGRPTHHNASMQIFADGDAQCRAVWIADLLPHELAEPIAAMIEQGLAAMKRTLERGGG